MVKSLAKFSVQYIPDTLQRKLDLYQYAFNPSILKNEDRFYLAIRLFDDEKKSIVAKLFMWRTSDDHQEIDLSGYFYSKAGINKVADPKLFLLDGKTHLTFNDGYMEGGENSIVLASITENVIDDYWRCAFKDRQRLEKNWAFFLKNDTLHVLYGLDPLKILKEVHSTGSMKQFEVIHVDEKTAYPNHTIGTPLVHNGHSFLFMGHQKFYRKGKRVYMGKAFSLSISDDYQLKMQKTKFIHSLRSLLGVKKKFNKNLISCTYFSGIYLEGNRAIIGYGINDTSLNIISLKQYKIWP